MGDAYTKIRKIGIFVIIMRKGGKIGFAIVWGLTRPLAVLPLGFHHAMGNFLGWLAGDVLHYRRDVVMTNISRSFPDKKYDELEQIRKRFYRHFGNVFTEAIWFGGCRNPERLKKAGIVEITNPGYINDCFDKGRSVFVMASHVGNWELYGGYEHYADFHFDVHSIVEVYKRLSSPTFDRFIDFNRKAPIKDRKTFDGVVETDDIMRYVIRHKDEFRLYNFITDQSPYSNNRVKVNDFMHQETWSMVGVVSLARKFKLPVLYLDMPESSPGHYKMTYTVICDDASTMEPVDVLNRYYELLQASIEAQPWNYLWTHKRWKLTTNQ